MKVITLLNEKGGVGKTTLAIHLAAGIARRGFRVLFIDTDAQEANATAQMDLVQTAAIYNLLVRPDQPDGEWKRNVQVVGPEKIGSEDAVLYWVASNEETRDIATRIKDGMVVRRRLDEMQGALDYVVFDTSPTPNLFHATLLAATDHLLIPTQLEDASLRAVQGTMQRLEQNRAYLQQFGVGNAELMGIIPNMYRASTSIHNHNLERLQTVYPDKVWNPIRLSTVFAEASFAHETLFAYAPEHERTHDVTRIVDRVLIGTRLEHE